MKNLYIIDRVDEYASAWSEPISIIVCARNSNDALSISMSDECDHDLWYSTDKKCVNTIYEIDYGRLRMQTYEQQLLDPEPLKFDRPAFKEVIHIGVAKDSIPLNSIIFIHTLEG